MTIGLLPSGRSWDSCAFVPHEPSSLPRVTLVRTLSARYLSDALLQSAGSISVRNSLLKLRGIPTTTSLRERLLLLDAVVRFAPKLRLHPNDANMPCSVRWYLQHVRMRRHRQWWPDNQILALGDVTIRTLVSQSSGGEESGMGTRRTAFFLEIAGESHANARAGDLATAECYVHLRGAPHDQGIDIQYWFFYAYNSFGPGHEGDWEHVTVRLDSDLAAAKVFFASHASESVWRSVGTYRTDEWGHPVVYVAEGSHACYPVAGQQDRGSWYSAELPPDDFARGGGPSWDTWKALKLVGERSAPVSDQEWLRYTGHWGEIGDVGTSKWFVTSGPYGPAFQAWWDDDDEGNRVPGET
jgi:hypothetical protein